MRQAILHVQGWAATRRIQLDVADGHGQRRAGGLGRGVSASRPVRPIQFTCVGLVVHGSI